MKILIITSEPISADRLRDAIGEPESQHAEVLVVAPALHQSGLRFWISDADEAIALADDIQRKTVSGLQDAGIAAAGDTGEGDVMEAVGDALTTFPADRILLFTHSEASERYREDVDVEELRERFPVPVEHRILDGR